MGFPKIRGTFLGVPIILKFIVFGAYIGVPLFRATTIYPIPPIIAVVYGKCCSIHRMGVILGRVGANRDV